MTQKSLALSLPSMVLPILSHPQSIPRVTESQVKILKNILKKAKHSKVNVNLAILEWRNRHDIRQSSDIDAQSQEPIVPPRIPTKVPQPQTQLSKLFPPQLHQFPVRKEEKVKHVSTTKCLLTNQLVLKNLL